MARSLFLGMARSLFLGEILDFSYKQSYNDSVEGHHTTTVQSVAFVVKKLLNIE